MKKPEHLGYVAWHEDAMRRARAGQKQVKCVCHNLWHWFDERKGHKFKVKK